MIKNVGYYALNGILYLVTGYIAIIFLPFLMLYGVIRTIKWAWRD